MSFLGETCAISELIKPRPSPPVTGWFEDRAPDDLFIRGLQKSYLPWEFDNILPCPR